MHFSSLKKYKLLYYAAGPSYNNVINSQYGKGQLNLRKKYIKFWFKITHLQLLFTNVSYFVQI